MFKNILLASDGSKVSQHAAKRAIKLAKMAPESHITLIHIVDELPESFKKLTFFHKESSAYDQLLRTKQLLKNENILYTIKVISGDICKEIIHNANSGTFDLLVIGSRGLTTLQQFVLGSVSYKVMKKVKIPILIVKDVSDF